jgi:DNA mismatch repair ATPase MutS
MRMTAAGIVSFVRAVAVTLNHVRYQIMAQMGMFVPAQSARYIFQYY